jgi:hypothetical protein
MARSNNGGEGKPARPPARRRADKAAHGRAPSLARDTAVMRDIAGMSLRDADFTPSPEEVQRRAYELFVQRGGGHGRDLDDWYEAERQLRRQEGKEPPLG